MFPDAITAGDGLRDVIFGQPDGSGQIVAQRQRRRDGRRIGATGAVRAHTFDERRGQKQFRPAIKENVHRFAPSAQMAAFDERGAAKPRVNFAGGGAHIFDGRDLSSG